LYGSLVPFGRATADASGTFRFAEVPPGDWWVGPAPKNALDDLALLAQPLRTTAGETEYTLTLRVHRGLYLRGRVLEADGSPCARASIWGETADVRDHSYAWTSESGEFELGPLIPGRHRIQGEAGGRRIPPLFAEPRLDGELLLRLPAGVLVAGTLTSGGERAVRNAWVSLKPRRDDPAFARDPGGRGMELSASEEEAEFEFEQVVPGVYDLSVETERGEFATYRKLAVEPGAQLADLRIELRPGARIEFSRTRRLELVHLELFQLGELVASGWADRVEGVTHLVVPPGELLVRIVDDATDEVTEHSVRVEVGQTLQIELP
jgi:hypothetical protein